MTSGRLAKAIAWSWVFVMPAWADSVYDCVDAQGRQILQDRPCQGTTLRWIKNGNAPSASTSPHALAAIGALPVAGMNTDQVRKLLGSPLEISQEEVVEGRVTTWSYPGQVVLQFDSRGLLVSP